MGWPFKKAVTVYVSASGKAFSAVQFEGSKTTGISGTHTPPRVTLLSGFGSQGAGACLFRVQVLSSGCLGHLFL